MLGLELLVYSCSERQRRCWRHLWNKDQHPISNPVRVSIKIHVDVGMALVPSDWQLTDHTLDAFAKLFTAWTYCFECTLVLTNEADAVRADLDSITQNILPR